MLSRKGHEKATYSFPEVWTDGLMAAMQNLFEEQLKEHNKQFAIFAEAYPDEVLLMASLLDTKDQFAAPVTLFISNDLSKKDDAEELLNSMVDTVGIVFNEYFSSPDEIEYFDDWNPIELKKLKAYYKINRENVGLTIMANKLLED
jgi:hypothetical protein